MWGGEGWWAGHAVYSGKEKDRLTVGCLYNMYSQGELECPRDICDWESEAVSAAVGGRAELPRLGRGKEKGEN